MVLDMKMQATWEGGFTGQGQIKGEGYKIEIGIPSVLGGSGVGANPKELLTSAAQACLIATLRAITENKKIPVQTLTVETEAHAADDSFVIKHIARVTLAAGSGDAEINAALRAVETADKVCEVGNVIRAGGTRIDVTPDVTIA